MYQISYSKKFKKSYKRISKNKKFNSSLFEEVVNKLSKKEKLPEKFNDHQLKGELKSFREFHLAQDISIIYYYDEKVLFLFLMNIGSHSELF